MSTFTKTDYFVADQNVYDISEAGAEVMAAANDLFATGDAVTVATGSRFSATKTTLAGLSALLLRPSNRRSQAPKMQALRCPTPRRCP